MNSTENLKSSLNTLFVLLTIFTPKKIHKNLSKLFGKMEDQIQILISENFLLKQESDKLIEKHQKTLQELSDYKYRESQQIQLIAEQTEKINALKKELKKQNHIETQTDFKAFTMVFNLLINADYYSIGYANGEYFIKSNQFQTQRFQNLNQVITHLKSQNKIQKG